MSAGLLGFISGVLTIAHVVFPLELCRVFERVVLLLKEFEGNCVLPVFHLECSNTPELSNVP